MIRIVHWVLLIAPLGIFALVSFTAAQFGWSLVRAMLVFELAIGLGFALLICPVLLPAAVLIGRHRPLAFLKVALPSLAMGFSTTSSLASLPVLLEAAEELRLPRRVSSFVLPLGASLNRPVPSASVVSLAPAFIQIGLPLGGLSLLIGLARIPDMFRTMTNVAGHVTAAATVAGPEREATR